MKIQLAKKLIGGYRRPTENHRLLEQDLDPFIVICQKIHTCRIDIGPESLNLQMA
jgi:hypothetical protein